MPVGAAVFALAPRFVRESRLERARRRYDPLGTVAITGALALLVYTVSRAPFVGWGALRTIVLLVASGVLALAFVAVEGRVREPLVPFRIFRVRTVTGANVVGFLLGATIFSSFFVLTLYVQDVLRYSALEAGVTFFVTGVTVVLAAGTAQALVTRVGVKPILASGLALLLGAMIWYSQIPVDGSFGPNLLPGYLMVGAGIAFAYVPVTIAALAGVEQDEAGLASGMINTAQQMGGAVGVALASTVFVTHIGRGPVTPQLLTDGYALSFWLLAGFAAAALLATLTLVRREELVAVPAVAPTGG